MICAAILARNEANRYLRRTLANCRDLCDAVVLLDDGSTDDTAAVAREFGAEVTTLDGTSAEGYGGWWGGAASEAGPRAALWRLACERAGSGGWVYVADADHELIGIDRAGLATLCAADAVNAWAMPLLDCWDDDETHRVDGYWIAWRTPRAWLFRVPPHDFVPHWGRRDLHVGHAPPNLDVVAGVVPVGVAIRHLGYIRPADRQAKAERYLALA